MPDGEGPTRTQSSTALSRVLLVSGAVLTAAGAFVHLREWLDTYRDLPAGVPGSWLVRLGFPVYVVIGVVLTAMLLVASVSLGRLVMYVSASAVMFHGVALAMLIASRTGTVFGWTEPQWTTAAEQSRAVEIGALLFLSASIASDLRARGRPAHESPERDGPLGVA